jgi:hypothetical protein
MSDTTSSRQSPSIAPSTWRDALRLAAVVALIGAAAIHFAYAPSHFDEAVGHGVFFVVVAWAQLAAAFALMRWRNRTEPWLAAAALSLGVIAVWVVTRTTGLPGWESEAVGFADSLATAFQALTILAAVVAVGTSVGDKAFARLNPIVGVVATLAVVGLVSAALNPDVGGHAHDHGDEVVAGDSAASSHDHDHGDEADNVELVSRDARCDIGFNTATFNETARQAEPAIHDDTPDEAHDVDFTLEEFAEVFVDPDNPMADGGVTPEDFVEGVRATPEREGEVLSGGMTHSLEPDNWLPMTDHEECQQLADELERTIAVAERYPTAQDAIDAGYWQVTAYLPAIASHYINPAHMGEFDIDNPAMLLYDGDCDLQTGEGCEEASIVGISHYMISDEYPDVGFTGPNDHWHRHVGLCMAQVDGGPRVIGGTSLTEEQCQARGGSKGSGTDGYMNHVWIVPGCESDWGVFSGANPALVFRDADPEDPFLLDNTDPIPSGCGAGKTLDDPLDFDEGGHGPSLNN